MKIKIGCLSCGQSTPEEAQSFLERNKSHCEDCDEDCLGFIDECGDSLYEMISSARYDMIKQKLTEDQKKKLINGKTVDVMV